MRFLAPILAFIVANGAATLVLADPPAPQQQPSAVNAPAATAAPSAPVAPASSAPSTAAPASQAKSTLEMDEKLLISKGYKPEMRNGQKVFCRRDDELGSRLGSVKHCATVEQWKLSQQAGREETESIQRTQVNPTGH